MRPFTITTYYRTILILVVAIGSLPAGYAQFETRSVEQRDGHAFELNIENSLLTATIINQSLRRVLEQISTTAGIAIIVAEDTEDRTVSLDVKYVRLDDSLRQLLSHHDSFFHYSGLLGSSASLKSVWVYRKGSASSLQPVPPELWASNKDLEAGLRNPDPEERLIAYEALLGRPDHGNRKPVIEALRGTTEKDSIVRQRILSSAITRGIQLPPEVLGGLARNDESEQIRWLALDALSEHSSAKFAAELSLLDPSEGVREKAKEILANLNAVELRRNNPPPGGELNQ